ncbi:MAG: hypothetical protein COB93_03865 [Sneathiella sp.]|nr:MAG: hypothetical protein COB93_03865 [Sneathiella sp.]
MGKSDNIRTSDHIEISIPNFENIRLCPFNSGMISMLTIEFERRCNVGQWCGFATIDGLPQDLPAVFSYPRRFSTAPLCTVIFLKNTEEKNFLFQSTRHGFVLLDEAFHLLHQGFSLNETLDKVQDRPVCH